MKAVIWTGYGSPDGLIPQEVEKPVPKDDEVLIKIRAAGVTAGDCEMRRLELPLMLSLPMRLYAGLLRPKRIRILGQELAGEVEAVGKNIRSLRAGDAVFGATGFGFGAYAEYICLPEEPREMGGVLATKPDNLSYEEAAVVPTAGFEALHCMRQANIQPGKKVLIIGAGGSIGTYSTQLASYFGAEVTGVDQPEKLEIVRASGAQHFIDYTKENASENAAESYDVIIDVVGRQGVARRLRLLKPGGDYCLAYAGVSHIFLARWVSLTGHKKLHLDSAQQRREDLNALKELIEAGKLKPVIDRSYPLEQVAEAHRYVETGRKKGNVAIQVG